MKIIFAFCLCLTSFLSEIKAQPGTRIKHAAYAPNIGQITNDSVVVITGSTYAYTVDTPEDKGLVATDASVKQLLQQLSSSDGSLQVYSIKDISGNTKSEGKIETGDKLVVNSQDGKFNKIYPIALRRAALSGQLTLQQSQLTINIPQDLTLYFTAGQRSPDASVKIYVPAGIGVTMDNTTVNVIGRGEVKLSQLEKQSIGRVGSNYSYSKVGVVAIAKATDGGSIISFTHLDLRPANGVDLTLVIRNVKLPKAGTYNFKATYTTTQPEALTSAGVGAEVASLTGTTTIADFQRVQTAGLRYRESPSTYTSVNFKWNAGNNAHVQLFYSTDDAQNWKRSPVQIDGGKRVAKIAGLLPNKLYTFRLEVKQGVNRGYSNTVRFYSGKMDIKNFGASGQDNQDNTEAINKAITYINQLGGGTLLFSPGTYAVRTIQLKSNVYLIVDKGAIIKALKGGDAPETTWFSDKKYRSGLSPTDEGPYLEPENWLTKQDVGHHYFRNTMFFGERLDNVKIIGNGYITGNGNLVTGDRVMNNAPDNRSDKMFTLKLCTNLEIGGYYRNEDLWYDEKKDEPYYIKENGIKDFGIENMLHIDRAGHFALLATGTDNINVHDTYFGKNNTSNVRDIYDFMQCNNVTATNIYCKVSSDDIVKPGSDCSLGFTRPSKKFRVRNIIGDTNCNLFQIGSETADDITDACVDNIYVLGANKAGFSISTNDGAHVKDIHLNCGHTGKIHSRSKMYRTTTPFFISISNRARILGADVSRFKFDENGKKHDELLVTNVNIGVVENIILNHVDITEVYGGSSFGAADKRWKPYDGKQRKASPIVAGYALPDPSVVEGGLTFRLPNGKHTGYVKNIVFNDVHVLVKGTNPLTDTAASPPELGVGQYNVANLGIQPAYGLWARHVKGLSVKACSFNYEKTDARYVFFLDDVVGGKFSDIKMVKAAEVNSVIKLKNATDVVIEKAVYFNNEWGKAPVSLPANKSTGKSEIKFTIKEAQALNN
ncbi:endopygalactorunase [Segetibacter sp. 3557_3]|uniref:endopygalactorunase n=1 Tax=Segetibacter sp. 3557_3 TaxID=2547429 RepID=UPI001058C714|nr:endopygalactorunase [Segetibacter sp. 3557_3]TDH20073.1 endopygalactorunase [Segetibacter sp. 3557_3]